MTIAALSTRILATLASSDEEMSFSQIVDAVREQTGSVNTDHVIDAIDCLLESGEIESIWNGKQTMYFTTLTLADLD